MYSEARQNTQEAYRRARGGETEEWGDSSEAPQSDVNRGGSAKPHHDVMLPEAKVLTRSAWGNLKHLTNDAKKMPRPGDCADSKATSERGADV